MEEQQTKTIMHMAQTSGVTQCNSQQKHGMVRLGRMKVFNSSCAWERVKKADYPSVCLIVHVFVFSISESVIRSLC